MCELQRKLSKLNTLFMKLAFIVIALVNMVFTITGVSNVDITSAADCGNVWKQWIFSFIVYLPFFTQGLQITYVDSQPDGNIPRTTTSVPWTTTAYILGALVGSSIFCWLADKHGRRVVAFAVATLHIISWVLYVSGATPDNLVAIKTILGVASSGMYTILPVYVLEISRDWTKRIVLALMMLMMAAGCLVMKLMVMCLPAMSVGYLMMAIMVAELLLMFVLVETPSYFVMKGQIQAGTTSLSKLKCMDADSPYIIKEITKLTDESDRAKADGPLTLFHIIKNRIWRDAAKVGVVLLTVNMLGGSLVYLDHRKVLELSQSTVDQTVSDLTVPAILVAGSLVGIGCLAFWESKYLITFSYAIMGLFLGILGVFMQQDLAVSATETWIPVTALAVVIAGYAVAWGLPHVVMVEILNLEIRVKVIGALYTYAQVIYLLHVHTYQYIERNVGIYALCYFYAMINIFGAVYAVFGIPETRHRSVKQIERSLKRIPPWLL